MIPDNIKYGYATKDDFLNYYNRLKNKKLKFIYNFNGQKLYQFYDWQLVYFNKELKAIIWANA